MSQNSRGFSLVELSIVLVILGLLAGGVLTGQSLIKAAELRSVTTTLQKYQTAVGTFRDKYFALPGDMANATLFWTAAATCPGDNTTPATGTETCNGNGNGIVDHIVAGDYKETYRAWQHLANAGLIEGKYTGVWGAASQFSVVAGTNAPRGKISGSAIMFQQGVNAGGGGWFASNYNNVFEYGAVISGWINGALLKPEDLWNIDTKMDDGKPAYGTVMSMNNTGAPFCVSTDVPSTADYLITSTVVGCAVIFKSGF